MIKSSVVNDGYNQSYLKHVKFAKREYQLLFVATGFMFCMEEREKFPEGQCQRYARIVGCSHGTRFFDENNDTENFQE